MKRLLLVAPLLLSACMTRPKPPEAPVAPPANASAPTSCVAESFTIYFDEGVTLPGDQAEAVMDAVAESFAKCDLRRIEVSGHADPSGDAAQNQEFSEARAKSVLSGLVARGLLAEKIAIKAYGERESATPDGEVEPLNRKTEVRLIPDA